MKRLIAGLLGILLVVPGCARTIDGSAVSGVRDVDPAAFFAGSVPTHGEALSDDALATQAYLRAIRRIDPCGFTTKEALARIGDVVSTGAMVEFNACELEIKVAGSAEPKLVSVAVAMTDIGAQSPAFTVGDRPVYPYSDASCGYEVPLPLHELPGAPALTSAEQPYLQIADLVTAQGCDFAAELTKAVVAAMSPERLPLRDALSVYPIRTAESDPCAVLDSLRGVATWNPDVDLPYVCAFTLQRNGTDVGLRLELEPRSPRDATEGYVKDELDGVEVYVGNQYCSSIAFVGDELQRRTAGGSPVEMGEWATAPAAAVRADEPHCDAATDVAVAAGKTFG